MNIDSRREGGVLVVTLAEKRLDSPLAQEFKDYMRSLVDDGDTLIILDLSQVTFIDSTGLGAIVASLKYMRCKDDEAQLRLLGIAVHVMSLFKLTRMDRVFPIYDDLTTALRAE